VRGHACGPFRGHAFQPGSQLLLTAGHRKEVRIVVGLGIGGREVGELVGGEADDGSGRERIPVLPSQQAVQKSTGSSVLRTWAAMVSSSSSSVWMCVTDSAERCTRRRSAIFPSGRT
jgi:hypothetical protein